VAEDALERWKTNEHQCELLTTGFQSSCCPARVMSGLRWRGSSFVAGSILMVELLCVISRISSANSCRKIPRRDEYCHKAHSTVVRKHK
jgi:hypothetical protein